MVFSPAFASCLCDLYFHALGINFHILGNDFRDVRLYHFHHFRGAVYPVGYKQDLQPVFCNVPGAFFLNILANSMARPP